MESTHMGSIIWGDHRYIPHVEEDVADGVGSVDNNSNVSYQPPPIVGSGENSFFEVADCDEEEMYPFDPETFVDRLVEDESPPPFAYERARGDWIWEAPVAAGNPRGRVEIGNKHAREESVAGKPYVQPIFFWPEPGQVCEDEALVVQNGPPGWISSPGVMRGVNSEPVKAPRLESDRRGGSRGCYGGDTAEFEPVAIDNVPAAVDLLPLDYQMPWVPVRSGCDDFCVTSSGPITYANGSKNALEPVTGAISARATSSSITVPADPSDVRKPLIGAGTEDYDDDHNTFLRKQEVMRYVGAGYLDRPGKSGLVTPEQRASLVDWLSKVHAAAPAASGSATPLSVEALALAVNILDRFLSTSEGGKVVLSGWGEVKIASVACLGLASKYEDTQPPTLLGLAVVMTSDNELKHRLRGDDLVVQGGGDDDVRAMRKEIVAMEQRVSSALDYRLTVPTVISFLGAFIHRACRLGYLPEGQAKEVVRKEAERILLRVLRESCSLSHLPSALAAAALYWAFCITPGIFAPSSFTFFLVTGYQLDSLYCCLRDVEVVRIASGAGGMGWGDE